MSKTATPAERHRIWLFGQSWDFHIVTTDIALLHDFGQTSSGAAQHFAQKRQIILHATAGNGGAEAVINGWNASSKAGSAHYVLERTSTPAVPRPPTPLPVPDRVDVGLADVVRVTPDDFRTFHTGPLNKWGIGIEVANVANAWWATNTTHEPSYDGRHSPVSTCPHTKNIGSRAAPRLVCPHGRPQDLNHYITSAHPFVRRATTDFQAYEEEQYTTMILLLRHLCHTHRIPKRFIGSTLEEVFRRYWHHPKAIGSDSAAVKTEKDRLRNANRRLLTDFRGILCHHNQHANKPCPGVWNRNRLFRGITDEWWMPIDRDLPARNYYSGPFFIPPFTAGSPTENAYFRPQADGTFDAAFFRDADIEAVALTPSFFDVNDVEALFNAAETTTAGWFPVSSHRWWHGGIHIQLVSSPWVYAAASGTIVAARLASNADTDTHPSFGSQRFVLIRHAVHLQTEPEPDGTGRRIDYSADPTFIFTLYMHLDAVANIDAVDEQNPPWFNAWRRDHPAEDIGLTGPQDSGRVFAPDVMVAVGDVLGKIGSFHGRRIIHFETLTHRNTELTVAPWNDPDQRVVDTSNHIGGDQSTLDTFLNRTVGADRTHAPLPASAASLRASKIERMSEWAVTSADQLDPMIGDETLRSELFPHIRRFSFFTEAAAANPRIAQDLAGADGICWHYHPITLMNTVNKLVLTEHHEIQEQLHEDTNVNIDDDGFISDFVDFNAGAFTRVAADNERIEAALGYEMNFRRREIACQVAGPHVDGIDPTEQIRFALVLLEFLDRVREHFAQGITIDLAHLCGAHLGPPNPCVLATNDARDAHVLGVAVDFRPANRSRTTCARLWQIVRDRIAELGEADASGCIGPSRADMPHGFNAFELHAHPASAQTKLEEGNSITGAEASSFVIHVELIQ